MRKPKWRSLRVETCETRNLLAAITGTVFEDLTGDGFSADDLPAGGVTVELIRDGGDGLFGTADDVPIGDRFSAAGTGQYAFDGLADGRYFLRQQVPSDALPTAGPDVYVLDIVGSFVGSLVDDFQAPDPSDVYYVSATDPDPTLGETADARILGGERDLFIDVVSTPTVISAQVQIGAGEGLSVASMVPGVRIILQYDGNDTDIPHDPGPPPVEAQLVDSSFDSPIDLTAGGLNAGLRIDFDLLDAGRESGGEATDLEVTVIATSTGGAAEFSGLAPEAADPSYFVPFSSFVTTEAFSFTELTSLAFVFNERGNPDVDFRIRSILAENPDAAGFNFGNFRVDSAVDIEKSTNGQDADTGTGPLVAVGETVTWTYEVTNSGNVPLADVVVSDDQGVTPVYQSGDDGNGLLDVGETWFYEATGTAAADQYGNLGAVTAVDPLDRPLGDDDPSHYFGVEGSIEVEKSTNGQDADEGTGPLVPVGETITWTYRVTNTGNVALSEVNLSDHQNVIPVFQSGDDGNGVLDVGETWLYGATGIAVAGQYENIAFLHAYSPLGDRVRDTDRSHYFGVGSSIDIEPGIEVEKSTNGQDADEGTGPLVPVGETVTWTYRVTNTGNVALSEVNLRDLEGVIPVFQSGDDGNGVLDVGETWIYEATGIAVAGQYENIAFLYAESPLGDPVRDTDRSHYFGVGSSIDIEKATNDQDADTGTGPLVAVGETVTWTYEVANTGNVPLTNVVVTDDQGVTPVYQSGDDGNGVLDVGETWFYEATGTAAADQYSNLGTVTAVDPLDQPVGDDDPSHYFGVVTGIGITKTVNGLDANNPDDPPTVVVGEAVTWRYEISNTGNVPLTGVVVTDDDPEVNPVYVSGDDGSGALDAGETWIYEATSTAVAGSYKNVATVTALVDSTAADIVDDDPVYYMGELPERSGLSGYVYCDTNNDGFFERTIELPIHNTTVVLTGRSDLDDSIYRETTTDDNGYYEFTELAGGTYSIYEVQPDAYLDGKDTIGTPGGVTRNDAFLGIALPGDYYGVENNFGELGLNGDRASKQFLLWPRGVWEPQYDGTSSQPFSFPLFFAYDSDEVALLPPSSPLSGTAGDDLFEFTVGPAPGQWTVTINGVVQQGTGTLEFDALDGHDTVILHGTDGDDRLTLGGDYAALVGDTYSISVDNVEAVTVDGRGGTNVADVYDSAGNDTLKAKASWALMSGPGFEHTLWGFGKVQASASEGYDVAMIYDSPGDDLFMATPTTATFSGDNFAIKVNAFNGVHVYGTAGGYDVAELYDSPGDDLFVGNWYQGAVYTPGLSPGYYNRAKFFEEVNAYATAGGYDVAKLFDSAGDDLFTAERAEGALSGTFGGGFNHRAHLFDAVHAYATDGGYDRATLFDSAGDDLFVATPQHSALFGTDYFNRAKYFEEVNAHAETGNDEAWFLDSAGDDFLEAAGDWARLSFPGGSSRAAGFDAVTAESAQGGSDTKRVDAVDFLMFTDGLWLDR